MRQEDGTLLVEHQLTQAAWAELVSTTRENINNFINRLREGGYIEVKPNRQIAILLPLPRRW